MRVSINLSEEMLERVDLEAKRLGTSRGAMLTAWVGEKVANLDMSRQFTEGVQNGFQESIQQALGELLKNEDIVKSLVQNEVKKGGKKNAKK